MNSQPALRALTLAATVVLAGCGEADPTSLQTDAAMSASLNGAPWEANYQIQLAVADYYPAKEDLEITGLQVEYPDSSTEQITVVIRDFSGPGVYSIAGADSPAGAYYVARERPEASSIRYESTEDHTGSIIVESMNADTRWVTGTFEFGAAGESGTVEVKNGSFRGRYVIY